MNISGVDIGSGHPTQIVAEISANHLQDIDIAKKTIAAISEVGVNFIKFQSYTPDTITLNSRKDYFKIDHGTPWDSRYLYDLYEEAHMPWEWHYELFEYSRSLNLIPFSSPFDATAVDLLEELNVPIYKIASYEITDIPLIRYVAQKGKPVILSSGVATNEDLELAINTCREVGNQDIFLLKCTSTYPTVPTEVNLRQMLSYQKLFNVEIGLSDHTVSNTAAVGAVALGASIIEKHIILDKTFSGPDSAFSISPEELSQLQISIKEMEACLGAGDPIMPTSVINARRHIRSLFIAHNVKKGDKISFNNVKSVRPGNGIHPKFHESLIGRTFVEDVEAGEPLEFRMID